MTKYQAGVGPSMTALHIYEIPAPPETIKLSLCGSTNVVRNYKSVVSIGNVKLCKRVKRNSRTYPSNFVQKSPICL